MKFDFDTVLAVVFSETLLIVTGFYSGLIELGFFSFRALIVGICGAIGGLIGKKIFYLLKEKFKL